MSRICPECGYANSEEQKRCRVCNADLGVSTASQKYDWNKAATDTNDYSKDRSWFRSYLTESIILTLCCCLPMGILGVVFSSQALASFKVMDYEKADRKANAARKVVIWGLVLAFLGFVALYVSGIMED